MFYCLNSIALQLLDSGKERYLILFKHQLFILCYETLLLQKSELVKTKEDNESLHKMIEGVCCVYLNNPVAGNTHLKSAVLYC